MGLTSKNPQSQVGDLKGTNTANATTTTPLEYMDGHCSSMVDPQPSASAIVSQPANDEPLFQIKKWNLIALWKWDVHSDVCAICRANVMEACPTCQSENKTSDCVIVWGTCNHSFHNCCIVKWIKRNNRCPLCQQEWRDSRKRQLN